MKCGNREGRRRLCEYVYTFALVVMIGSAFGLDETAVKEMIRLEFPKVSQIPTDSLVAWQSKPCGVCPLLLDVREEKEYAVSHLKGARRAVSEEEALDVLKNVPKDTLLVVYCSVGHRSSELAQKLMDLGFTNVHNLEGSIFEWANRGLPAYQDTVRVQTVHPFDDHWGRLLRKELRSAN
jgi:rhodanese-related sulfurtransferase